MFISRDFDRRKVWTGNEKLSLAGNRTPFSRVTGGDTHHYTTENCNMEIFINLKSLIKLPKVGVQQYTFSG